MRNLNFKHSIPQQGYRLIVQTGRPTYDHIFCGLTELIGAISPFTGKPLLRFLSLDTRDPRLELEPLTVARIELLYSLTCRLAYIDFYYKLTGDRIEILSEISDDNVPGSEYTDTPYLNYPLAFPAAYIDLMPADEEEKAIVEAINETQDLDLRLQYPGLSEPYHQVGGEPYFVQKPDVLSCPGCGKEMSFFASIGNYNGQEKGFFDNDYMQVIYQICKACCVIGAYNICD